MVKRGVKSAGSDMMATKRTERATDNEFDFLAERLDNLLQYRTEVLFDYIRFDMVGGMQLA